jgi:hypothetical protein
LRLFAGKSNQLVGADITVCRQRAFFQHFVCGMVLQARDEIDSLVGPLSEKCVVVVAAIHHDDRAGVEREGGGHLHIAAPGFGDQHVAWQVVVVVE